MEWLKGWRVRRAIKRVAKKHKELQAAQTTLLALQPKAEPEGPTTIGDLIRNATRGSSALDENYALDARPEEPHCPECDLGLSECDCESNMSLFISDEDGDEFIISSSLCPYDADQIAKALDNAGLQYRVTDDEGEEVVNL